MGSNQKTPQKSIAKLRYFSWGTSVLSLFQLTIEEAIEKELKSRLPKNSPKLSKTNLIREAERLKTQKVSHFQDYKEGLMTRETYMEKRQNLDNSIMEIEEQLKVVGRENIAFDKKMTREVVDTHIERIVVNGQGSFTVVYR